MGCYVIVPACAHFGQPVSWNPLSTAHVVPYGMAPPGERR